MKSTSTKPKNAREFDHYFEDHDIVDLLETTPKRINVDVPRVMLAQLDSKARELGLTRQALLKYWIAEKLGMV